MLAQLKVAGANLSVSADYGVSRPRSSHTREKNDGGGTGAGGEEDNGVGSSLRAALIDENNSCTVKRCPG